MAEEKRIPVKMNIVRDPHFRELWKHYHPKCLACGTDKCWIGMQFHHIIGAAGRSDEESNASTFCGICHMARHGKLPDRPSLSLAHTLWLKKVRDPENWNPERLAVLLGHALPEIEEPPEFYLRGH